MIDKEREDIEINQRKREREETAFVTPTDFWQPFNASPNAHPLLSISHLLFSLFPLQIPLSPASPFVFPFPSGKHRLHQIKY
jgi:hypothetical protein